MSGMHFTRKILAEFLLRYGRDGWNSFPDDVDPLPWKPRCSKKKTCMDLHFGCEILATQPRDCYDLSASSILGPDDLLSRGFQRQQQISISTTLLSQRQTKHLNRPKHKVPASDMLLANDIVESRPCSLTGTLDFSSRLKNQITASEMPHTIERTRSRENVFFQRQTLTHTL
jgi:hypothetical protein